MSTGKRTTTEKDTPVSQSEEMYLNFQAAQPTQTLPSVRFVSVVWQRTSANIYSQKVTGCEK